MGWYHVLYVMGTELAKGAVHFSHIARFQGIKEERGEYRILLQLGEENWNNTLEADTELALARISYCQDMLDISKQFSHSQSSSTSEGKQAKDLFNHDFLIIELQQGPDSQLGKFCIKTEKVAGKEVEPEEVGEEVDATTRRVAVYVTSPEIAVNEMPPKKKAGIEMSHVNETELNLNDVSLYTIDCQVYMPWRSLLEVLTREKPHYNVKDANCWDYARNTTKWLLEECVELTDNFEKKSRLQKELKQLEGNLARAHVSNFSNYFTFGLVTRK